MARLKFKQSSFLPHQWQFINDWHKTLGLIGGLGSGKTTPFLFKALYCHIMRPGANGQSNIGIGYPSHKLGKSLFFIPFMRLLEKSQIQYRANVAELSITTQYGKIAIMSMHNPERIIGETFTDVGLDELDTLPKPKGMEVVRRFRERMRGRKDSQLFIVSSPEGFSTCYDILQENPNPNTMLIHAKTTDNRFLPQEYIDDIMATYDENTAQAYINGQFVNLNSMQAHYAFKRERHVNDVPAPIEGTQLHIGIDFNVTPMTACVGYYAGDKYCVFAEYYIMNANTFMLADLIYADYAAKHPIICYPDPTGESRKTSSDISDLMILQKKGFDLRFRHGISQRRSLNATNGALDHDRVVIDRKCTHLITDLEQVVTDEYGQIDKPKGTMLTHISDAMRNVIMINSLHDEENQQWSRR